VVQLALLAMSQKEFFVNTREMIDVHGATNIPTTLLYRSGKAPIVGNEALSLARDRDDLNEDFKVDLEIKSLVALSPRGCFGVGMATIVRRAN
jgi:hypothetical protein